MVSKKISQFEMYKTEVYCNNHFDDHVIYLYFAEYDVGRTCVYSSIVCSLPHE